MPTKEKTPGVGDAEGSNVCIGLGSAKDNNHSHSRACCEAFRSRKTQRPRVRCEVRITAGSGVRSSPAELPIGDWCSLGEALERALRNLPIEWEGRP